MPAPTAHYRVVVLTADRADDVNPLADALAEQALVAGNRRSTVDVTTDAGVLARAAAPDEPMTVVVVLSAGPATAHDPTIAAAIETGATVPLFVLPVLTDLRLVHEQCPPALRGINAWSWRSTDHAGPLALVLLRLLGLSEEDRRIFLSHRRTDGGKLAEQLRLALNDDRWDVFLDRFSIPPALDFQRRLDRELADKAFVLLLETPEANASTWVEHEIAFAKRLRLGLMSLALPHTTPEQLFPALDDAFRRLVPFNALIENDPVAPTPPGGHSLTEAALADVVAEIELRHASAHRLRRESVMLDVTEELRKLGYEVDVAGRWALVADRDDRRDVLHVTARAPVPADLRTADDLRRRLRRPGATTYGWVVHPTEDIDEERADLLRWLLSRRRSVQTTPVMLLAERMRP